MATRSLLLPQSRIHWWRALAILVAMRCLAAWFSVGYYHADEHFQLLEFASLKMGHRTAEAMPWEWDAQMRPGLQPWLVVQVWRGLEALGADSPGTLTLLLRVVSGLVGAVLFWLLWRYAAQTYANAPQAAWWVGLLVLVPWYLPYQHVRFSSETWGSYGLLAGYLLLHWPRASSARSGTGPTWQRAVWAGVCFGLAFQFRYQTAFFTIGLMAGLLTPWAGAQRLSWRALVGLVAGGVLALGLAAWVDYWLYGSWQFPPYNYVVKNIVEDQAAQFGTHPWWFYPDALVQRSYGPWGLLFLAAALVAVVRQWRQPLVWGVWLFVLGHTAVGHKEFRFLWPLVPFTALLVVLAWQGLGEATRLRLTTWARSRVARALGIVVLAANGGMLLATSLMPAKSDVWVLQAVYDTWGGGQPICIIEGSADQLFRRNNYHEYTFYRSRGFVWVSPDSMAQRVATGQALPQPLLLTVNRKGLAPPDTSLGWCHCHLAVQYFPPWMSHLNVNGWLDRTAQYVIYQCEP